MDPGVIALHVNAAVDHDNFARISGAMLEIYNSDSTRNDSLIYMVKMAVNFSLLRALHLHLDSSALAKTMLKVTPEYHNTYIRWTIYYQVNYLNLQNSSSLTLFNFHKTFPICSLVGKKRYGGRGVFSTKIRTFRAGVSPTNPLLS
jgi:hypothetical protein